MNKIIDIGAGPVEEDCAHTRDKDFAVRNRVECNAFIEQIKRAIGTPPKGVTLYLREDRHDFGPYCEVAARVEFTDRLGFAKGLGYAYRCESEAPTRWDLEARLQLAAAGYAPSRK